MAYQLGDIATRVQQRVKDLGFSSTEIKGYINDAQNDVFNEYRLRFMETTQDYTLTASNSDITAGNGLPTDYVQAISIILTTGGLEKKLVYKDYNEIDFNNPDATDTSVNPASVPNYWYIYGNTIRVFPAPLGAYTVTLKYLKRPTALSSDSDVPSIPSEFEELLIVGAAYRVHQVKDNFDKAAIYESKFSELLQKLVNRYSLNQTGQATQMRINRVVVGGD